jgi:type I restriction enzyme, S subunit
VNSWPQKRLAEVCELVNGRAFQPSEWSDQGLPIIRIQNLNDPSKPFNYCQGPFPEKYLVREGEILLSWSGTPGTSFGCFRWRGPDGWLNQHIFNVKLSEELHPDFFVFQVNSMLDEMIAKAHGGVGLQHVTKGVLGNLVILVPELSVQVKVVTLLKEADYLRRLRAEVDQHMEDLIPALFHEMFGDSGNWPHERLQNLLASIDSGWSPVCLDKPAKAY